MKEKLKTGKLRATLSIIFLILLCLAILDWEKRRFINTEIFHIISAILFGISYIGFLIFGTKKDGTKITLTIFISGIALGLLFMYLKSTCYSYYGEEHYLTYSGWVWKDFSIISFITSGISIIALLLNLIWRPNEHNNNRKTSKNNKKNIKKENLYDKKATIKYYIIGLGFILVLLPIIYYFCFALPKHNHELEQIELKKLEYQKQQDEEKKQQEEEQKQQEEEQKRQYDRCIQDAENTYNNIEKYCNIGYQECTKNIDEYNRTLIQKYDYYGNSNEKGYGECEKFKYKDNGCFMMDKHQQVREDEYKRALENCERLYNK